MQISKYILIFLWAMLPVFSDDWPGFGGEEGTFKSYEDNLKKTWERKVPQKLGNWRLVLVSHPSSKQKGSLTRKDMQMGGTPYTVWM